MVAKTANGRGSSWRSPSIVTARSCIASSSAACVFAGARLISSHKRNWANTGPCLKWKRPSPGWKMLVPVMSAGIRSGVNWMRP